MTAADRPSVTDNAGAEAERRYGAPDFATPNDRTVKYAAFIEGAEWAADRAETTTATVEDAARAIHDRHCTSDDHGPHCMFWGEDYESAEALHARGLLATARTFPTREDLARAIAAVVHHVGYEPDHPAPNRHDYRAADAVLALLRDGA